MKIPSAAKHDAGYLCDRIRLARHAAKLSQTALAERVKVTPSAAAQWEHPNGTRPGIERLKSIAKATGMAFEWLATGEGNQKARRPLNHNQEAPAVTLSSFAQDVNEELLLDRFRRLSPRARDILCGLLAEITTSRREKKRI